MTDQIIRRFQLEGQTKTPLKRRELELQLIYQMSQEGYSQLLDVNTTFKTQYDLDKDIYNFTLTMQGVFTGDESWNITVTDGRTIHKKPSVQS